MSKDWMGGSGDLGQAWLNSPELTLASWLVPDLELVDLAWRQVGWVGSVPQISPWLFSFPPSGWSGFVFMTEPEVLHKEQTHWRPPEAWILNGALLLLLAEASHGLALIQAEGKHTPPLTGSSCKVLKPRGGYGEASNCGREHHQSIRNANVIFLWIVDLVLFHIVVKLIQIRLPDS